MIDDNPMVRSVARAIDGAISRAVQGANAASGDPDAEIARFREVREKTLAILGPLTIAQAVWSPQDGKWTIAQIADHLLLTEEMYREQFQRLIRTAEEGGGSSIEISLSEVDVGFAAIPREVVPLLEVPMRMFNLFVPHALRETMIRYPIVASLNPRQSQPREGLALGKLRQDLARSLEETEEFFARPMPRNADELTINHPILGNNTIVQSLRILIAHEQRHQEQMERIQARADFPRVSQEPMSAAQMADVFGGGGN
jgi:hypothetical protein